MGKKRGKTFMVFHLNLFELLSVNSFYYFGNTRSSQSMCYEADLKSQISLKITFSNSIWFGMMKK